MQRLGRDCVRGFNLSSRDLFLQSGVCNFLKFFFCKICHCGDVEKPTEPGYVLVEIKSCGGPQSSRRIMNPTLHPGGARMMLIT